MDTAVIGVINLKPHIKQKQNGKRVAATRLNTLLLNRNFLLLA